MFEYQNLKAYMFLFFWMFEDMDPFLWNILKFTKNLKWYGEHLIKETKKVETKKPHVHMFFLSVLNV